MMALLIKVLLRCRLAEMRFVITYVSLNYVHTLLVLGCNVSGTLEL
jgi:hypothetical protein